MTSLERDVKQLHTKLVKGEVPHEITLFNKAGYPILTLGLDCTLNPSKVGAAYADRHVEITVKCNSCGAFMGEPKK